MKRFHQQCLERELGMRQRRNPAYSLRSFARDLELNPGTLSAAIKGERRLPKSAVPTAIASLRLSPSESVAFAQSNAGGDQSGGEEFHGLHDTDDRHFRILSEWEYFATLNLVKLADFGHSVEAVSTRLGISIPRAKTVVEDLRAAGYLDTSGTRWLRLHRAYKSSEDVVSQALRRAHAEELQLAAKIGDEVPLELREFTSATIAIDQHDIPEAKRMIRAFRDRFCKKAESRSPNAVYLLGIQFLPLTKPKRKS